MTIEEALAGLSYPVCHPPYRGGEPKYVTFQLLGQFGTLYADDAEAETSVQYMLHLWARDGRELYVMLHEVRAALEAADWIVAVDTQIYDPDSRMHRLVLSASAAGALYG